MTGDGPRAPGLTHEQRTPLGVRGASVALSSGAGCGKTTVLTARYLAELDGDTPRPPGQVVALTFTEKAARELRDRVRRACRGRLAEGDDPGYWRGVLRALEAAPIGTFHGFCAQLLRRFAVEAGIDPGFAILEESIAPSLREEALAACIRRWLAESRADLVELSVEYGLAAVRRALSDLMAHRSAGDFPAWAGRGPGEVVEAWREAWGSMARPAMLRALAESARPCLESLAAHECTHPVMNERREFLGCAFAELETCADPVALLEEARARAQVKGGGTKAHWPSEAIYKGVQERLEKLRKGIDAFLDASRIDEDASREGAELGQRFARLAAEAVEAFGRAKREAGLLDFDDLLHAARALLRDGPEAVRAEVARSVGAILVDEFQDTDPIQAEILDLLAGEEATEGRLFLVGDPKQSIYRFRGARPRVFEEFRGRFPEAGRLALTENFRSVPGVIDFVNALFADAFPDGGAALRPGPGTPARGESPDVEFLWATEPDGEPSGKRRIPVDERRRVEARWIARRLARRLEEGWPVRDPATREVRPAHAGDIALLFRTLNDAAPYERALVEEGLDYHVVGGSAFFAQQEVLDLINVLSAIEDPLDTLALAGSLRSPFFCVSDEGLYWLATSSQGDLPRGFDAWQRINDLSADDRRNVARAHELLGRWRGRKDREPIAALVGRVLDESGYEAALAAEFLGPRKRANCRKLVRLARRYDAHGGFTLADFVARLRADLRKPPREEQAATTDEYGAAVRLMTIHQAKGLEFPIVVVPDLDRDVPISRDAVAFHPDLGLLSRLPDEKDAAESSGTGRSLGWTIYRHLESREEEAEALRLFYVATTRARDALILSAGLGPDEEPRSPALRLLASRFDRASGACRVALLEGLSAPEVRVTLDPPPLRPASSQARRTRSRLLATSRLIVRAMARAEAAPAAPAPRRAGLVDLDPAGWAPPTAARIDRLIRSALAEPEALDPKRVAAVVGRMARAQVPMASPGVEAEARERLTAWVGGRLVRQVARSPEVRRALSWAVAWPPGDPDATVFQGQVDLAYRDAHGDWCLLTVSVAEAPEAGERLRLLLSAQAAGELGFGPVVRGWRVRLGPGGGLHGEEVFDPSEVERALRDFLDATPPKDRLEAPPMSLHRTTAAGDLQ
jgi:ATP-dependent helicase/nuclease subunit A